MSDKEVIIDLSKKIKLTDSVVITLGRFIFALIIVIIQLIFCLYLNDWKFQKDMFLILLNFMYSFGVIEKEKKEES